MFDTKHTERRFFEYLSEYGFEYCCSNRFDYEFPNAELWGFSEFDALFVKM
jgi:hypothetical protein